MRALILVLVAALTLLLVRCMVPGSSEAADALPPKDVELESAPEAPARDARFLTPPSEPAAVSAAVSSQPVQATAKPPVVPPAAPERPSWLADIEVAPRGDPSELAIAAALVHGGAISESAVARTWRVQVAESFAAALAGDTQRSLELAAKLPEKEVGAEERALLQAALTGKPPARGKTPKSTLALAMETALLAREAEEALAARNHRGAVRAYSDLLQRELSAPWDADPGVLLRWSEALGTAQEQHRWNPKGEWARAEFTVEPGENLIAIRKRYLAEHPGALMCTGLIERTNRLNGFLQPGAVLRIPTEPARVLVDLGARWALYLIGDEVAGSWQVGIGRAGEETPPGDYQAGDKLENPPWMKTGQPMVPFGDPANPLGTRWIGWFQNGVKTSYGFHGTTDPASIGQPSSDGCVRFHNADVEELFRILPEGAPIHVRE